MQTYRKESRHRRLAQKAMQSSRVNDSQVLTSTPIKLMSDEQKRQRQERTKKELQNNPIDYAAHMPWLGVQA